MNGPERIRCPKFTDFAVYITAKIINLGAKTVSVLTNCEFIVILPHMES